MNGSPNLTRQRTATFFVVALLLAYSVAAQQTTTTLQGTVVNAVTHQPIARALVSLDQYSQSMLTDNEGRFAFEGIPQGQTTLSARRPGYASDDSGGTLHEQMTVPGTGDLTLELTPLCAITGQLLLPNDDIPDALQVQLLHQEIQNGRGHWAMYRTAEATSEGRFRFGNLAAGSYLVHVGASLDPAPAQQPPGATGTRTGYVPAYYPGVRDIAGAGVITLTAGKQADAKMELTREPYYPIAIPVANYDEARGVNFEVVSDSFLGLPARFSPNDGMVHMDLPSGHYVLEAHGYGPRSISGQKEFDVNGGALSGRSGAIALLAGSRIPVTVHTEFTHTTVTGGNGGSAPTATGLVGMTLQRQDNRPATRGSTPSLQDDGSGGSSITGAAPGRYWVYANAFAGYIASMTSGGVDLLTEPLTVNMDGSASPIDITLHDDGAAISATLASSLLPTSPGVQPPMYLQCIPLSGPALARSAFSASFQADGTVTIGSLPPGSYLAIASTSRRQVEYRNSSVIAAFAGKGQTVSVEPGGSAHVTIDSLVDLNGAQ